MPDTSSLNVRFDDTRRLFVLELTIKGLRTFEALGSSLADVFTDMAEQLENEGI